MIYIGDSAGGMTSRIVNTNGGQYVSDQVCLGDKELSHSCTHFVARHNKKLNFGFLQGHVTSYSYNEAKHMFENATLKAQYLRVKLQ